MKQCRRTIQVLPNKFSQFQSRMKNCVTKRRSVSTERFINQGKCLNCFFCSPLLLCQFSLECVAFLLPDAGFASCTMQWNVQLCNTLSMRGYTHYGLRGHLTQNQYSLVPNGVSWRTTSDLVALAFQCIMPIYNEGLVGVSDEGARLGRWNGY